MATRTASRPRAASTGGTRSSSRSPKPPVRRPSSPPRSRTSSSARSGKVTRRSASTRRPSPRSRNRGPGLGARLVRAVGRAFIGIWMLLAHGVGGTVRHLGRGARSLEREQRRDGLGLSCIAVALVVALGAWADSAGPVGHYLTIGLRGLIGSGVHAAPGRARRRGVAAAAPAVARRTARPGGRRLVAGRRRRPRHPRPGARRPERGNRPARRGWSDRCPRGISAGRRP